MSQKYTPNGMVLEIRISNEDHGPTMHDSNEKLFGFLMGNVKLLKLQRLIMRVAKLISINLIVRH